MNNTLKLNILLAALTVGAAVAEPAKPAPSGAVKPASAFPAAKIWPDTAPADCPFPKSALFGGIEFTGRHAEYKKADTWYPTWSADGNLYSGFTDGSVDKVQSWSASGAWNTGNARIEGDNPLKLKVIPVGVHHASAQPYGGRYPCGNLSFNGVWYYGTYCLDWCKDPWDMMGPFVGFRMSRDNGKTWQDTPCTPEKPLFGEVTKTGDQIEPQQKNNVNVSAAMYAQRPKVKMGSPHFVDFGKNMELSPDGMAYLLGHGATRTNATCTWVSGDQVYLARVKPSTETMNDVKAYEFFAGNNAKGEPVWVKEFAQIKPLLEWNDRLGCVTATWNPGLKRFLLCVTDGGPSGTGVFDTTILESEKITGPWKRIAFMEKFGPQAYFVNIPSKFISADGRTMWLCYAANWGVMRKVPGNPPGSRYGLNLQEIRLLAPGDTNAAPTTAKALVQSERPDATRTVWTPSKGKIPESPLTRNLKWQGVFERHPGEGYWCWSAWPVQDDRGKFHIFGERWLDPWWGQVETSELCHYTADKPEGPYTFVGIPLSRGPKGTPDHSLLYPCVQRNGKGWAMMYTGINAKDYSRSGENFGTMRPFVALADSLDGPWRKMGMAFDLPTDPKHWAYPESPDIGIHCAIFIEFHGKWLAYFKAGLRHRNGIYVNHDYMGVAVADRPEGPYKIADKPCILDNGKRPGGYIEDVFPFVMNDKMYLLVDDNFGQVTGVFGGIALFESDDGLNFDYNKATLAVKLIPDYYKEFDSKKTTRAYGPPNNPKLEGPRILFLNGKPAYFFGTSGQNIQGGNRPLSYILKFAE